MNFFQRLVEDIKNSIYNPSFYADMPSKTGGRPIVVLAFISALAGAYVAVSTIGGLYSFVKSDPVKGMTGVYTEELVITIKDGVVSTNVESPYFIENPEETPSADSPSYLAVIDTREDVPFEELAEYDAFAVLGRSTLFLFRPGERGDDRSYNLSSIKEFTLDKKTVDEFAAMVRPWIAAAVYLLPLIMLAFITLWGVLMYLFLAVFGALTVKLIALLKGLPMPYGTAYVTALYALIPVLLFDLLTDIIGFGNSFLLGALVFIVILLVNLGKEPTPVA